MREVQPKLITIILLLSLFPTNPTLNADVQLLKADVEIALQKDFELEQLILEQTLDSLMSELSVEKQRYDGWYNNRANPDWGSVGSKLSRRTPAAYSDGVYQMGGINRPSPRQLSEAFSKGLDGIGSRNNKTAMMAFFGQAITSEILMASEAQSCPLELSKIKISRCDEMYDKKCDGELNMPFYRASYDRSTGQSPNSPREQQNKMSAWIDGSFIYSTVEPWLNFMRSYKDGNFQMTEDGYPPFNTQSVPIYNFPVPQTMKSADPSRMYLLGDPRVHQNPAILTFGILFYRWHNVLAKSAKEKHPDWSDEDIFQRARRLNIATLQNIIFYEYLPVLLGKQSPIYTGYNPDINPSINHVFQSAAFRFGHTLIPPGIYLRGPMEKKKTKKRSQIKLDKSDTCNFLSDVDGTAGLRLCSNWWNAQEVVRGGAVENILRGLSSQISEREDATLCADIRNKLFGPLDFSRRDLAALNIMRGRDSGLPDYNTVRKHFKLPPISNWSDINPVLYEEFPEIFNKLEELYGYNQLKDVDLYIGGMLESNQGPGPLFSEIISDQFQRLRDGDRFWFENTESEIFTAEEIEEIRNIKLWDVIVNATNVKPYEIQKEVFKWIEGDPCGQPKQLAHQDMKPCIHHEKFDYFMGSEMAFMYGVLLLVVFPAVTIFCAYLTIIYSNTMRRRIKRQKWPQQQKTESSEKMYVREILHEDSYRFCKAKFGPGPCIKTVDRKGNILTCVEFNKSHPALVKVNVDHPGEYYVLIKAKDYHDLVFSFDTVGTRKKFLLKVENLLRDNACRMDTVPTDARSLINSAETKDRREKRLEHFFREAYAVTFGVKKYKKSENFGSSEVMRINLTQQEFASALGMKPSDMFVRKMFKIVDKEGSEKISFKNFLDTLVLFTKGNGDDKLRIMFELCDEDNEGRVKIEDFKTMLSSLIDIAKTEKIDSQDVDIIISSMLETAGLRDASTLTYSSFKSLMSQFRVDLNCVGLDCKGTHKNFLDMNSNVARMEEIKLEEEDLEHRCKSSMSDKWHGMVGYLEENRQSVFYLFVFYMITIGLFLERFLHFSQLNEHNDFRKIMGYGLAITRGSAASLTFSYTVLLLTVCRNLITKLKELSVHQYIPLDLHLELHKIVAYTALFFSLVHSAGHIVNFYHASTQPNHHLHCMSGELLIPSNVKPDITFWLFKTMTGLTGLVLYVVMIIIFVFAYTRVRKQAYKFFWATHQLYIALYFLSLIHGLARITQPPRFWIFAIGPATIFAFDKIISLKRRYLELDILETTLLPSDVIKIKFYRPPNFRFLSGQFVKASCTAIQPEEFHSLTITSAPHEDFLSLHIKAIGSWTWKLRNFFDPNKTGESENDEHPDDTSIASSYENENRRHVCYKGRHIPKMRLEGPYGGGNQDWYKFEVAVMIGAGIGVTPYASILNDLVFGTSTNRYSGVACKKVYFLWICPSHRSFEWFIDVLRDVEEKDVTQVLEIHIFITQFFHKFDLRTTMLYICENHFQQLSRRSLFTGLRAQNHFGRPDMNAFLKFVQRKHNYVTTVGVFSCGPRSVTRANRAACEDVNKNKKLPFFKHHYEHYG